MFNQITTLEEAKACLARAQASAGLSTRLTRSELYSVLAMVYSIKLSPEDEKQLFRYIKKIRKAEGANRAFYQRDNYYTVPLRYVFPRVADRTNVSRYAGALSELAERQVTTTDFLSALKKHGGLSNLYDANRARKAPATIAHRSRLVLNKPITVEKDKPFTLTLQYASGGTFQVLACETQQPD